MKDQTQENQPDLFSQPLPEKQRSEPLQELRRSPQPILLHTTLEQIIFYAIVFVLYSCAIFFFGVLRGKALVGPATSIAPPVSSARQVDRPTSAPAGVPIAPQRASGTAVPDQPVRVATQAITTTSDPTKPYTIQLLSHRKKDYADRDAAALRRTGVVTFVSRKGDYYIVCAGQYSTSDEAASDLRYFRQKYKDCFLRRK